MNEPMRWIVITIRGGQETRALDSDWFVGIDDTRSSAIA